MNTADDDGLATAAWFGQPAETDDRYIAGAS